MTVEALYEASALKPLVPLPGLPEHTKVRITVEVSADMEQHDSAIDKQPRNRRRLHAQVVRHRRSSTRLTCSRARWRQRQR
jgi:hypothetical protein